MPKLLIVDPDLRWHQLAVAAAPPRVRVLCAGTLADARACPGPIDVLVLDPGDGAQVDFRSVDWIREKNPSAALIVLSGSRDSSVTETAMKYGASDFIRKTDRDATTRLSTAISAACERTAALLAAEAYRSGIAHHSRSRVELLGESRAIERVRAEIAQAGRSGAAVLILGPQGTGKSLAARAVHSASRFANGPFVVVNAPALRHERSSSDLFGHARGSFTGAERDHMGFIERANGGTLFVDEIGEMDLSVQASLLIAFEDKIIQRLGDDREREVSFQLVTATNRDVDRLCREGKLRSDFLARIGQERVHMPALLSRREDVVPLASHFLGLKLVERGRSRPSSFAPAALDLLVAYDWPGNVRELKHVVERLIDRSTPGDELVTAELVSRSLSVVQPLAAPSPWDFSYPVRERQRQFHALSIQAAMERTHGDQRQAAKLLGLPLSNLRYDLRKLGFVSKPTPHAAQPILLVDNDPGFVSFLTNEVGQRCEVIAAFGGHHAFALLADKKSIAHVLCDVRMPDMTGPEVFTRLLRERPELAKSFTLMSGFDCHAEFEALQREHGLRFVEKRNVLKHINSLLPPSDDD